MLRHAAICPEVSDKDIDRRGIGNAGLHLEITRPTCLSSGWKGTAGSRCRAVPKQSAAASHPQTTGTALIKRCSCDTSCGPRVDDMPYARTWGGPQGERSVLPGWWWWFSLGPEQSPLTRSPAYLACLSRPLRLTSICLSAQSTSRFPAAGADVTLVVMFLIKIVSNVDVSPAGATSSSPPRGAIPGWTGRLGALACADHVPCSPRHAPLGVSRRGTARPSQSQAFHLIMLQHKLGPDRRPENIAVIAFHTHGPTLPHLIFYIVWRPSTIHRPPVWRGFDAPPGPPGSVTWRPN